MAYKLSACGVLRLSDCAFIPQDSNNRDWLEFQQWQLSGGQVLPADGGLAETGATGTLKTLANKWLATISRQP
ncbi:hypothetical protein HU724_006615 [Pseudomonas iranensis]|uniref:hypothetical protein n=1 Tax=Pseudomonas iranensis TaxID=2745503 RepID=UPI001647F321|nr:hypothetical protein [Pseudomonas iranensis]QXI23946.1 hypothetical protein HU724_006615 [Pseudomonas iranensis]